ncbi:MAG TPA: hypothetical protein VNA88_14380 [Candidatus Kapabacteria bacterium]|nr:hypothetical protein [Candidatus Kapabacteria bacterium]
MRIQNTAGGAANGQTTIRSSVGNALDVSTSAAGEAALKVTGGLSLTGPVGTATIAAGMASTVVSNVYAKSGSIILLTVNNAVDAVPLRIVSQGDGTFTVGLASALVGTLTGDVSFNYLIVNQ